MSKVVDIDGRHISVEWENNSLIKSMSTTATPYGQPMTTSTNAEVNRYKYSGKEFETEFGLNQYDFHARTHLPQLSLFTAPDPKAGNYPWLSPYLYCAANPLRYIDPTGEDYYKVDANGNFSLIQITDDNFDRLISTMGNCPSIDVDKSFIGSVKTEKCISRSQTYGDTHATIHIYEGGAEMTDIYNFLTSNTVVEWSLVTFSDSSGQEKQFIGTTHMDNSDSSQMAILDIAINTESTINTVIHCHSEIGSKPSIGDTYVAGKISEIFPNATFFIKYPGENIPLFQFDKNSRTADKLPAAVCIGPKIKKKK